MATIAIEVQRYHSTSPIQRPSPAIYFLGWWINKVICPYPDLTHCLQGKTGHYCRKFLHHWKGFYDNYSQCLPIPKGVAVKFLLGEVERLHGCPAALCQGLWQVNPEALRRAAARRPRRQGRPQRSLPLRQRQKIQEVLRGLIPREGFATKLID